ncbi:cell division control 12 protein [Rutstroemia sp. NJR-2017a BVV2]|nr:cell division control 12 protein [Rutstroemia sp. NJR-2017a BVV2]
MVILFAVSGFPNIGVLGEMGQGQLQLEFHQQNLLNEPRPIETSETINFTNHTVQPHDRNFFPTQFHSLTSSAFLLHIRKTRLISHNGTTTTYRGEYCFPHWYCESAKSATQNCREERSCFHYYAGESGLGKTTFINTLFSTTIKNYADHKRRHAKQVDKTVEIEITKAELEEKFFKVRLTVIDTPGFGDYVNNRDSWMPIIEFLDDQHESYMLQEQQPRRSDKIDLRVHACLYFIRPTGHTLKPLDIEVMKRLSSRVNLIPVVAKADTLSPADLARFKQRIGAVIEAQGIKIYTPPVEEDDEAAAQHARSLMAAMPFAVIGSEKDVKTTDGRIVKGRQYSWGVAEVENEDHCDFKKLRSILIRTHMLDLIHTTEEAHYEAYRAQQMETRKFGEARPRKLDNPKFKEEEESLRKRFTEQVKIEEHRFRQWEQKLISERDRLNKDLESTHAAIKSLEQELEQMQGNAVRSHGRR